MPALALSNFVLPHWHLMTVALVGVASAGLALLVGAVLVGRRRHHTPAGKEVPVQRDPFVFGSATEKRISLRRGGNPVKVLLSDAEGGAEPEEAWVLDRSMGGLCLRVDRRIFEPGTIVSVRTANTPRGVPWTQLEVKSCREDGRSWELGCQFVKAPPWSVLLLFG